MLQLSGHDMAAYRCQPQKNSVEKIITDRGGDLIFCISVLVKNVCLFIYYFLKNYLLGRL